MNALHLIEVIMKERYNPNYPAKNSKKNTGIIPIISLTPHVTAIFTSLKKKVITPMVEGINELTAIGDSF